MVCAKINPNENIQNEACYFQFSEASVFYQFIVRGSKFIFSDAQNQIRAKIFEIMVRGSSSPSVPTKYSDSRFGALNMNIQDVK